MTDERLAAAAAQEMVYHDETKGRAPLKKMLLQFIAKLVKASSSRKHKQLRATCAAVTQELERPETMPKSADLYFLPFREACLSQSGKLTEIALDCIQKLVASGPDHLTGKSPIPPEWQSQDDNESSSTNDGASTNRSNRRLIDLIVETVYECASFPSDAVHLQVIKALLTIVTSVWCSVHEQSLMLAVRACYHIYLSSRNLDNQTSAKATLTQILNVIFQRMESTTRKFKQIDAKSQQQQQQSDDGASEEQSASAISRSIVTGLVDQVCSADDKASPSSSTPPSSWPEIKHNAPRGKFGWCVVCRDTADHFCLQTRDPVCSLRCKLLNLDGLVAGNASSLLSAASSDVDHRVKMALAATSAQLQNDSFLLFRALCNLSMKSLPNGPADQAALRSKVLSLELLLSVLEHSGHTFRTEPRFVEAIRQYLVGALLKNATSNVEAVFGLSLSMFMCLIRHFKQHLKTEIGVFLDSVFLRIAESSNSTFVQKMMVLKVFSKICAEPQTVVDIFLNYDCEPNSLNIFQHIIAMLEKITQSKFVSEDWISAPQEAALKQLALETLVTIMRSLHRWTHHAREVLNDHGDDAAPRPLLSEDDKLAFHTQQQQHQSHPQQQPDSPTSSNSSTTKPLTPVPQSNGNGLTNGHNRVSAARQFSANFEKQRKSKKAFETGVLKFNMKPKHGIAFLAEAGLLEREPKAIGQFLARTSNVSKTMIGEYLGDPKEFNLQVLDAYVGQIAFPDDFDQALRKFMSGFWLPGEAQKIDRIMDAFGKHFVKQHPTVFAHPDVAFMLAFSCIMLNSDAHSEQVKRESKMTCDQFLRNNRGINDDTDLPEDFLRKIYHRIVKHEIKMKNDDDESADPSGYVAPRRRHSIYRKESQRMVQEFASLIETIKKQHLELRHEWTGPEISSNAFYFGSQHDLAAVRPMFEICWLAALATFSVQLERTDEARLVQQCLHGFRYCIRIGAVFQMDTEVEAFVTSLASFTLLGTAKQMRAKHIEAIKMLLSIAYQEGDNLKKAWFPVLKCISDFELLQLRSANARSDSAHFDLASATAADPNHQTHNQSSTEINPLDAGVAAAGLTNESRGEMFDRLTNDTNSLAVAGAVDPASVDRIFAHTQHLRPDALVDFVTHLCGVATQAELASVSEPRVFSLRKIVEVCVMNLNLDSRLPEVWAQLWQALSEHFGLAGCHTNQNVALYALDSLRQLATKFLERNHLSQFKFQQMFFRPFERIVSQSPSSDVRHMAIECTSRIIQAHVHKLRSGWRSAFVVFAAGAADKDESVVGATFDQVERVLATYFPRIQADQSAKRANHQELSQGRQFPQAQNDKAPFRFSVDDALLVECLDSVINCLVAFGRNVFSDISLQSMDHLNRCATYLGMQQKKISDKRADFPSTPELKKPGGASASSNGDFDENLKVWFLILTGLSRLVGDSRLEVRTRALQVLFKVLRSHGHLFSSTMWQLVYRGALFPIFDDVRHVPHQTTLNFAAPDQPDDTSDHHHNDAQQSEWLETTCAAAMSTLVELFAHFFPVVGHVLPEVLALLNGCISQERDEALARIGIKCWRDLLANCAKPDSGHNQFNAQTWRTVLEHFDQVLMATLPRELMSQPLRVFLGLAKPESSSPTEDNSSDDFVVVAQDSTHTESIQEHETRSSRKKSAAPIKAKQVRTKCLVHILLIQQINQVLTEFHHVLDEEHLALALDSLSRSIDFAQRFNADLGLRTKLHSLGILRNPKNEPPELFHQESCAVAISIQILLRLFTGQDQQQDTNQTNPRDERWVGLRDFAEPRLFACGHALLELFSASSKSANRCREPVVCLLLEALLKLDADAWHRHIPQLFPQLSRLITTPSSKVRTLLSKIFEQRIGPTLTS